MIKSFNAVVIFTAITVAIAVLFALTPQVFADHCGTGVAHITGGNCPALEFPTASGIGFTPSGMPSLFYPVGIAIINTTFPEATGGIPPYTYAIPDGVPSGLEFDASSRVLSGTPIAPTAEFNVTYTVTDSATTPSRVSLSTTFNVCPTGGNPNGATSCTSATYTPLVLSPLPNQEVIFTIEPAPLILPVATGGTTGGTTEFPTEIYSITPIPSGISFDAATRTLSGSVDSTENFTITYEVRDAGSPRSVGRLATQTFTTVVRGRLMLMGTPPATQTYTVDTPITDLILPDSVFPTTNEVFTLTGPNGEDVSTLLPGLSFDTSTHTLSGTPTAAAAATNFIYKVRLGSNLAIHTISITVIGLDTAPIFGVKTIDTPQRHLVGTALTIELPTVTTDGNGATTYSLLSSNGTAIVNGADIAGSATPIGLIYNAAARTISGTPTRVLSETSYKWRAEDGDANEAVGDTDELDFDIIINERISFIGATAADQTYVIGRQITNLQLPSATGGYQPLTYALYGPNNVSLASDANIFFPGISFNPTNRIFSGTSTAISSTLPVTYVVTDNYGNTLSDIFQVRVVDRGASPVFTNVDTFRTLLVAENVDAVRESNYFVATGLGAITYTLGGIDAELFELSPTGTLTFKIAPNYEDPQGGVTNLNTYNLTINAADADTRLSTTEGIKITVTDVNEPPVVAIAADTPTTVTNPATFPLTAIVTDPDTGDTFTYAWTAETSTGMTDSEAVGTFADSTLRETIWTPPTITGADVIITLTLTVTDSGNNIDHNSHDVAVSAEPVSGFTITAAPTTVSESATPTKIKFTATLTGGMFPVDRTITVAPINSGTGSGTATETTDYTVASSTSLVITAGQTTIAVDIPFTAVKDTITEADGETVIFKSTLLNVAGDAPQDGFNTVDTTVTIEDFTSLDFGGDNKVTSNDGLILYLVASGVNASALAIFVDGPGTTSAKTDRLNELKDRLQTDMTLDFGGDENVTSNDGLILYLVASGVNASALAIFVDGPGTTSEKIDRLAALKIRIDTENTGS